MSKRQIVSLKSWWLLAKVPVTGLVTLIKGQCSHRSCSWIFQLRVLCLRISFVSPWKLGVAQWFYWSMTHAPERAHKQTFVPSHCLRDCGVWRKAALIALNPSKLQGAGLSTSILQSPDLMKQSWRNEKQTVVHLCASRLPEQIAMGLVENG